MTEAVAATAPAASAPSASSSSPAPSPSPAPAASPPASTSAPQTPSTPASPPATAPAAEPAKIARPSWAPETYWDAEKGVVKAEFGDHYKTLATFQATEESRRLTLPQSPNDYKAELPADFQAPQGIEFKIDANDPLLSQARQLMHDIDTGKLSGQQAFSKMLALNAAQKIGTVQSLKTARDAEVAKLGATGSARVTAIQNFVNAQLGDELGGIMGTMLVTARHVEGFEKLMANFRGQGAGSYAPSRAPEQPTRLSDAEVAKMTYSERKDYAARFTNGAATH